MRAWRLARRPYAALDGEGTRLHGGRWNSPGRPLVYLASHLSLALLEVRVNLDLPPELIPNDYVEIEVEIPEGLARERVAWAKVDPAGPAPGDPRALGDAWLAAGRTPLLVVRSFVVPIEDNILLDPHHPDAAAVRIAAITPFALDPRLFRQGRG